MANHCWGLKRFSGQAGVLLVHVGYSTCPDEPSLILLPTAECAAAQEPPEVQVSPRGLCVHAENRAWNIPNAKGQDLKDTTLTFVQGLIVYFAK